MNFKPNCLATAIGSLPHPDPVQAVELILSNIPDAPIWPQLPTLGWHEQMEVQYSEGMPCRFLNEEKGRMHFETGGDYSEAFASFYEQYMSAMDPETGSGDCSALAISPGYSAGIGALESRLRTEKGKRPVVKVQTTGPCSFSLTIVDENKRALFYNEEFRDMIVKALAMKSRWQIQKFRPFAERVICFIDEPILSAFGSSTYVSVQRQEVVAAVNEVVAAIQADGALAGVHCCGNTEWSILIDAGVDIVNFDAFAYGETIALYPDHIRRLLDRGGVLAWGVVPTSAAIREHSVESLAEHFEKMVANLSAIAGVSTQRIIEQAIITPSCGTGSLPPADAERVFVLLGQLSTALKVRHGL